MAPRSSFPLAAALLLACGGELPFDSTAAGGSGQPGGQAGSGGSQAGKGGSAGAQAGSAGQGGSQAGAGQAGASGSSGQSGQGGAGQAGAAGNAGNAGSAGSAGSGGDAGSAGSAGDAGQGGSAGDAGSAGAAGSAGGEAGGAGAAGSAGQAGAAGLGGGAGNAGSAGSAGAPGPSLAETLAKCQGSDQAFVRRAIQGVLGRKPYGQAEVQVYLDLMAGVDAAMGPELAKNGVPGSDLRPARRVAVAEMMGHEEYLLRWIDTYRDFLRVQRTEDQSNPGCYGTTERFDGTAVAEMVRDQPPDTTQGDGKGTFTMRDLLLSALKLDDLSPVYVANLFPMLSLTYPGANAAPDKLELSRRSDFGAWFDGVYLKRDAVCLRCHNSEASVTFSDDPAKNRHFPMPGYFEKSLFGASTGPEATDNADAATRMHAPLRYDGFANGSASPWGWSFSCGGYTPRNAIPDDIAQVNARFGAISGTRSSAWDLSSSLQAGFRKLRLHGLSRGPAGSIPDPDEAFAYLVSAAIVEQVWREVVGTPLTIANYFPRNAAARDQLLALTEGFVASGFSHRLLLLQIFQSPYFNLAPLDDACWPEPYPLPAIFDPWTTADQDTARRGNSPSDAVVPRASRSALLAAYRALGWDTPDGSAFPFRDSPEGEFQSSIGIFLKNAEPGFRGLDFQGRLGWESRFGSCAKPFTSASPDYIEMLLQQVATNPDAKVRDLVAALKDRLIGEASVVDSDEQQALETLLGASLDAPATQLLDADSGLRRLCGALLASPQFLMLGALPPDQTQIPALTPDAFGYESVCKSIESIGLPGGLQLTCSGSSLTVKAASSH